MTYRVLVIGGYGTFGGRLCDLLADEPRLTLIVAGRSIEKAQAFASRPSLAKRIAAHFDRDGDVVAQVMVLHPDLVVDASGPFQAYGDNPYALVRAAIVAGADYVDLADGPAFVAGVGGLDGEARAAGRFVLAGASSFPVLTSAVVRRLARDLEKVDAVTAGIAPSPYAGVGLNVIRAIASYAGKPVQITRDGEKTTAIGMVDSKTRTIAVPGAVPLRPIRFALVEVPDLTTLATAWSGIASVWVGAGPTPAILHRVLWLFALLVRWRALPSLTPMAPLMDWAVNRIRWGEHRGGMFVEVKGRKDGQTVNRRWDMIAEGDRGPLIPSMAIEILIRQCLDGRRPEAGARPADGSLKLDDYEAAFRRREIATAVAADTMIGTLYRDLLGAAFTRLPPVVQAVHAVDDRLDLAGAADVERGRGPVAAVIAAIMGFPPEGRDVPLTVAMERKGRRESWTQNFGGKFFSSTQEIGAGRNEGLLVERFGPFAFAMAPVVSDERLNLVQRRWTAFGIPMPRWLLPTGAAFETETEGRFTFSVDIALPLIGSIVRYRGWLEPVR